MVMYFDVPEKRATFVDHPVVLLQCTVSCSSLYWDHMAQCRHGV